MDHSDLGSKIQHIAFEGNAFAEHNIKFRFLKRRRDLILNDLGAGSVTDNVSAGFKLFHTTDLHTYGGIEFQSITTGGNLRISVEYTDLLTKLVDKYNRTVASSDGSGQFPECLGHQSCLKTYMGITHIAFQLCLRNQCGNRVNHHDIDCTGADHGFGNLQCLLSVIRLGNIHIIHIYADCLGICGIQCMLRINKSGNSSALLYFSDHMKGYRGLTGRFRSEDLYDSSLGNTAETQRNVQT